ncbi:hypothetical protein MMC10_011089 [Thelotrema lepadinum]|nr:hypothetical protein [Thelotrema lepadinum]
MLASLPATAFAVAALSSVAYGGSSVPIGLYTDINCENPSTLNSNVSLELDTCAVTPGLGSVVLNDFPCTSGDVLVYGFSDTSCGTEDDFFDLGSHCAGRASPGVYAAIMLSCEQFADELGVPTATTTIPVAQIATGAPSSQGTGTSSSGSSAESSSPSPSPTNSGDTSSSTDASSSGNTATGWNGLSTGAKVGIPVGSVGGVLGLIASIFGGFRYKRRRDSRRHMPSSQPLPHAPPHQPNVEYVQEYPKNAFENYSGPTSFAGTNNYQETDVAGNPINYDGSNNNNYGGPNNNSYGAPPSNYGG